MDIYHNTPMYVTVRDENGSVIMSSECTQEELALIDNAQFKQEWAIIALPIPTQLH